MFHTEILGINIFIFIAGLVLLLKGSDWFIESASCIARRLNVSEMVIGLTLVSIGTSLPEFATDIYATFNRQGAIVLGDIVGSNITNILLVLGLGTLLFRKINIPKSLVKRDGFIMVGIFILCTIMCAIGFNGKFALDRIDGLVLIFVLLGYVFYLTRHKDSLEAELSEVEEKFKSMPSMIIYLIIGLCMVFCGAKMLVDNVVWVALKLNLNQAVIAATVVAFGTSIPELAVTLTSVVKKKHDIALGNIVGSCIFNICLILGVCALVNPIQVDPEMMFFNLPVMVMAGSLLLLFMRTGWKLVSIEGGSLFLLYLLFIIYNLFRIQM